MEGELRYFLLENYTVKGNKPISPKKVWKDFSDEPYAIEFGEIVIKVIEDTFHTQNIMRNTDIAFLLEMPEFNNFMELIIALANAESMYKEAKLHYEQNHNNLMLNIDWDGINEDREEQGLPKLGNQDMKNAYIQSKLFYLKRDLICYEEKYNDLKRMYDIALKYSFEILKVSL